MIGSVFAMQGFGQLAATLVALITTQTFKGSLEPFKNPEDCDGACALAADKMWRIITGFGAIPGCMALYYRITIPETPRYTFDVARDILKAERDVIAYMDGKRGPSRRSDSDELQRVRDMHRYANDLRVPRPSFADFRQHFGEWANGKLLLGTSLSWFFLDIGFYGLGLNNGAVLQTLGFAGKENVFRMVQNAQVGTIVISCAGSIPGYWLTVALVDVMGRRNLQLLGFVMLTTLFLIIGFAFDNLSRGAFLTLYIMSQFFFNFGEPPKPPLHVRRQNIWTNGPRTQRNDLHHTRRALPDSIPRHCPWHLCRRR
jgi:PHS family inorganic phosphate transporter-like MFS transporter